MMAMAVGSFDGLVNTYAANVARGSTTSRRARGHIRRRGGSFQVLVHAGTDLVTGKRAGATITEVAGSHVSMVSHPRTAIDAIVAAAAAVGD